MNNQNNLPTPRLQIYPDRITFNAQKVIEQCRNNGVEVACVTKVTAAHPAVVEALAKAGPQMLADSRLQNLVKIKQAGYSGPLLLLRLPAISQAAQVVETADYSLNSSLKTMKALSSAAVEKGLRHRVIVMVDVGDLREGVWPDKVVELVKEAAQLKGIEVAGLGCNLACYGGIIPSTQNMNTLITAVKECRAATGLELPVVCGGNSSGLPLMAAGNLAPQVNLYRIGEAIILGRNVIDRSPWPGTRQDTMIAVAEVIEAETKPSMPIGDKGQDAFGNTPEFVDRGLHKRVICNVGRQDAVVEGLTPVDPKIKVLGASSDHLLLDVEDADAAFEVGDEIEFYPDYGALLALSTSEFVKKVVVYDE
jgi:predicted amino acid racemase